MNFCTECGCKVEAAGQAFCGACGAALAPHPHVSPVAVPTPAAVLLPNPADGQPMLSALAPLSPVPALPVGVRPMGVRAPQRPAARSRWRHRWAAAPRSVRWAAGLWLAAGIWAALTPAVMLIGAVMTMMRWHSSASDAASLAGTMGGAETGQMLGDAIGDVVRKTIPLLLLVALIMLLVGFTIAGCYVLLARALLVGSPVARVIATLLAGLSLLGLLAGPLTVIWVLLGVSGVVVAWTPGCSAHLRRVSHARTIGAFRPMP